MNRVRRDLALLAIQMTESEFIAALQRMPLHPGAQGLADDTARLGELIFTTDMLVEGVHFLATDPPADVAWKLVAVNLSDLAAKGAAPVTVLLNHALGDDHEWDRAFATGLDAALRAMGTALLGGDTVSLPPAAPRFMTLTAIGEAGKRVPLRSGARAGDLLHVTGTIGDAGAGLAIAKGSAGPDELLAAYRRPRPRLAEGRLLAAVAHAMMDISDGLLIDIRRMARASRVGITVDLATIPLSTAYRDHVGHDRRARLAAATAGDDYQLLVAAPPGVELPVPTTRIGWVEPGDGLRLVDGDKAAALPDRLGFEHGI